jgi:predicted DNA binding CopG/RHH family protein
MSEIDREEKELLDSFERGEWVPVPNVEAEKKRYQDAAKQSMKKDRRVNIRLSSHDLEAIQRLAVEEGLPYQTLLSSIIHRYATGRLVNRKS